MEARFFYKAVTFDINIHVKRRKFTTIFLLVLLASALLALPLRALAQSDDGNQPPASGDPCRNTGANPIDFKLLPGQGPAGSSFIIQGKPHDPRTVGPGSDVVFSWRELPNMQGVTASVGADGTFSALISVPGNFAPGAHQLLYEEASPYAQCPVFTVTSGQPATPPPGLGQLGVLLRFLMLLLNIVRDAAAGLHL